EVDGGLVERDGDPVRPDHGFAGADGLASHDCTVERARLFFTGNPKTQNDANTGRKVGAREKKEAGGARVARHAASYPCPGGFDFGDEMRRFPRSEPSLIRRGHVGQSRSLPWLAAGYHPGGTRANGRAPLFFVVLFAGNRVRRRRTRSWLSRSVRPSALRLRRRYGTLTCNLPPVFTALLSEALAFVSVPALAPAAALAPAPALTPAPAFAPA